MEKVVPLGGKTSLGLSHQGMNDPGWQTYKNAILALAPINTAEKAAQFRKLFEDFHKVKLTYPPQS